MIRDSLAVALFWATVMIGLPLLISRFTDSSHQPSPVDLESDCAYYDALAYSEADSADEVDLTERLRREQYRVRRMFEDMQHSNPKMAAFVQQLIQKCEVRHATEARETADELRELFRNNQSDR